MEGSHWRTSFKARAAVIGVTAIGLALYGLVGGGSKSVVPFQGKTTSTPVSDAYSVGTTLDCNSSGSTNHVDALAEGPNHSLYFYWEVNGSWNGPVQAGAAWTAYSGPSVTDEDTCRSNSNGTDNLDAAVEGPSHSLYFFWQANNTWYGPIQVAPANTTWSPPSITFDNLNHVNITAQGPNGSTDLYWMISGTWYANQVSGANSTYSAPQIASGSNSGGSCSGGGSNNEITIAAEGVAHESLHYYYNTNTCASGGEPNGLDATTISGQGQDYSAASSLFVDAKDWITGYQGPNNSNVFQWSSFGGGTNTYCVLSGAGTDYSAPGLAEATSKSGTDYFNVTQQGPSNSLYAFWANDSNQSNFVCPSWFGPLGLNGAGTTFSVPSMVTETDSGGNFVANVLVEGPSHTLWLYWSSQGNWNGPLQLGSANTTYDSST